MTFATATKRQKMENSDHNLSISSNIFENYSQKSIDLQGRNVSLQLTNCFNVNINFQN